MSKATDNWTDDWPRVTDDWKEETPVENLKLFTDALDLGSMSKAAVEASMSEWLFMDRFSKRNVWVETFAFAIPCLEAVNAIRRHAPVLDPLAGSGYWAAVLAKAGCNVVASDNGSWHRPWRATHYPVAHLDAVEAIELNPDRLVLLSWPNYQESIGARCLAACKPGQVVALISEGRSGCVGADDMFDMLDADWESLEEVEIPQFYGLHDWLEIWRKK